MKMASILLPALICLEFCDLAAAQTKSGGKKPYIEPPVVNCLALSRDGSTLALVERTLIVRLWDVAKSKDIRTFPIGGTRESYVSALAFSPDGKALAVAGTGRLEVWDIETGKLRSAIKNEVMTTVSRLVKDDDGAFREVREAVPRPDDVMAVTFSADGKTLFSSGKENVIKLWDPDSGKEKGKLSGHATPATHLALSTDGKVLASGTFHREIKVWDVDRQKEVASFDNGGASVYGLALSADGKRLLSSSGSDVILWDVAKKEAVGRFKGARATASRVAFSPDGRLVVGQGLDFVVWDAKTFALLATIEHSPVFGVAITPDSRALISCDRKGNVRVHDLPKLP